MSVYILEMYATYKGVRIGTSSAFQFAREQEVAQPFAVEVVSGFRSEGT